MAAGLLIGFLFAMTAPGLAAGFIIMGLGIGVAFSIALQAALSDRSRRRR